MLSSLARIKRVTGNRPGTAPIALLVRRPRTSNYGFGRPKRPDVPLAAVLILGKHPAANCRPCPYFHWCDSSGENGLAGDRFSCHNAVEKVFKPIRSTVSSVPGSGNKWLGDDEMAHLSSCSDLKQITFGRRT